MNESEEFRKKFSGTYMLHVPTSKTVYVSNDHDLENFPSVAVLNLEHIGSGLVNHYHRVNADTLKPIFPKFRYTESGVLYSRRVNTHNWKRSMCGENTLAYAVYNGLLSNVTLSSSFLRRLPTVCKVINGLYLITQTNVYRLTVILYSHGKWVVSEKIRELVKSESKEVFNIIERKIGEYKDEVPAEQKRVIKRGGLKQSSQTTAQQAQEWMQQWYANPENLQPLIDDTDI